MEYSSTIYRITYLCSQFLRWRVISLVAKMNGISLEGINNESVASFERELEKQTGKR